MSGASVRNDRDDRAEEIKIQRKCMLLRVWNSQECTSAAIKSRSLTMAPSAGLMASLLHPSLSVSVPFLVARDLKIGNGTTLGNGFGPKSPPTG